VHHVCANEVFYHQRGAGRICLIVICEDSGEAVLTACLLLAAMLAQQFSAPEGPDGLVYNKDWPTLRLATKRQGKWDAWKMNARPGNGGQPVSLSPAEAAQVEAHLKAIAQVVESTPYAQAQRGWYAIRSVAWIRTRFPAPGFPLAKLPVQSYYSLYPFHLMDKLTTRNGVKEWVPDWSHETSSISFTINGSIPGPSQSAVHEVDEGGNRVRWYAGAEPDGTFQGFPVYGSEAVIARKGRALFREVPLRRAIEKFLPLYREDVKTAEDRMRTLQQQLAETEAETFAQKEMAGFEQEYGAWRSSRPRDYEFRRKTRLDWIERARQEARQQATPKEGSAEGRWYWEPKRALEAVERLSKETGGDKSACFEAADSDTALYRTKGHVRAAGAGSRCKTLMEPNPEYFDAALPRIAPQLIRIGGLDQCIDVRTNAPASGGYGPEIPHGCTVHRALWAEMEWEKLAALLAP
jgi:hypothetical protein